MPVMLCGVAQEFNMNWYKSFFQSLPSACAEQFALVSGIIKFSASELAWGYNGVLF